MTKVQELQKQIVLLQARASYMSEAEPVDATMHSDSADSLEKLLVVYEAALRAVQTPSGEKMCKKCGETYTGAFCPCSYDVADE